MMAVNKTTVGIIVPTKDRPDFVIRQMNYYANLHSPHPIYYSDASSNENVEKVKKEITKLGNKLNIHHQVNQGDDSVKRIIKLLSLVKEKYVTFIGDDDYHVPNTLNVCSEFLENNPDYQTAMGRSVTIRVEGNGVYGNLVGIHDYHRSSVDASTASQRLLDYLGPCFSSIIAAVVPTKDLLQYYQDGCEIKDMSIRGEVLPCCRMIIDGKSKILDHLGLVRQIHKNHYKLDDMFDNLTNPEWNQSYQEFRRQVIKALSEKDGITKEEAENNFKKAFWFYLQKYLSITYKQFAPEKLSNKKSWVKNLRTKIATYLPIIKKVYRKIKPILSDKPQLHYEVRQPNSKYYDDFKDIADSLMLKK